MVSDRTEGYEYNCLHQDGNRKSIHGERRRRDIFAKGLDHTLTFILVVGSTADRSQK